MEFVTLDVLAYFWNNYSLLILKTTFQLKSIKKQFGLITSVHLQITTKNSWFEEGKTKC